MVISISIVDKNNGTKRCLMEITKEREIILVSTYFK